MTTPSMFCRNCYTDLSRVEGDRCGKCGKPFDRSKPRSYLARPFPRVREIVGSVILTTLFAVVVAWVVSLHQLARTSGH